MNLFRILLTVVFIGSGISSFGQIAIVRASKMNVLYRGVKNPISVAIPGVAHEDISVFLDLGKLTPDLKMGEGYYLAEAFTGVICTVRVYAIVDGQNRHFGHYEFRIKDVPTPAGMIAGVKGGVISVNRLAAAPTIIPRMENFDFELFFKTTSFDIAYQVESDFITRSVNGSSIPPDILEHIRHGKRGSRVIIENINAVMLDGNNQPAFGVDPKKLPAMSLTIE